MSLWWPSEKLLILLALPALILALLATTLGVVLTLAAAAGIIVLAAVDAMLSARPDQLHIERTCGRQLSLGAWNPVGWEVRNRSDQTIDLELTEQLPEPLEADRSMCRAQIKPHHRASITYRIRPTQRGLFAMATIHARYRSRFGLLRRQFKRHDVLPIVVYPNIRALAKYELAVRRHRQNELGLVALRQRGQGTNFESLREAVDSDAMTSIDWKATARRNKLIAKNFEVDRSQNIFVLLDCGRLMTTQIDRLTRLDYAINATLLLSYVTAKQSDYIGVIAFSDKIEAIVPAMRGRSSVHRINDALAPLQPKLVEPNYDLAFETLRKRHRKRSLIVILTDVVDTEASSPLIRHCRVAARHHVPLCVTLRDLNIAKAQLQAPDNERAFASKAMAVHIDHMRSQAIKRMRHLGAEMLDVSPLLLSPNLLNRYLQIKRRGGI